MFCSGSVFLTTGLFLCCEIMGYVLRVMDLVS